MWLYTSKKEKIPAVHLKFGRSIAARYTLLYSHGNAEDIALDLEYLEHVCRETQADIFIYEYVGYSLSRVQEGKKPSPGGCNRSIEAAWKYLVEEAKIPPEKIVLYGRSLGSGPTLHLAAKSKVRGTSGSPKDVGSVLLQSPLASGIRAVLPPKSGLRLSYLCFCYDIFPNYRKIGRVRAPIGIIHGVEDEVVGVHNGESLHSKIKGEAVEPKWLEGYGHNDIPAEEVINYAVKLIASLKEASKTENGSGPPSAAKIRQQR